MRVNLVAILVNVRLLELVPLTLNYADFGPDYWEARPLHEPWAQIFGAGARASLAPRSQRLWVCNVYTFRELG